MGSNVTPCADASAALAFIHEHGIVLVSAKGPAPRLTDAIAGEPITGSWWGHEQGQRIFRILEEVADSDQLLRCRLIDGKLTLVHRRLWPLLVRIAGRFKPEQLALVREEHAASGRHASVETPYPQWVPAEVVAQAAHASDEQALAVFGPYLKKS